VDYRRAHGPAVGSAASRAGWRVASRATLVTMDLSHPPPATATATILVEADAASSVIAVVSGWLLPRAGGGVPGLQRLPKHRGVVRKFPGDPGLPCP